MGIFEKLRLSRKQPDRKPFSTLNEYAPTFSSYDGGIYEQALTRAAIERFATAASKLNPEVTGSSHPQTARLFRTRPNPYTTWPKLLARVATACECDNNVFLIPGFAKDGQTIDSFWFLGGPDLHIQVREFEDEPWFLFTTKNGKQFTRRVTETCVLNRFQYTSDYFGEDGVLDSTMRLIDAQEKAQDSAIKNGAKIRFIGQLNGQVHEEDMEKKRDRFVQTNMKASNSGGLMIYDGTFARVEQLDPMSYVMDNGEMQRIQDNVCMYFGISMSILMNDYTEEQWNAWYESKIEPFALQLGEELTHIIYTPREQISNRVSFSSNRLQYASTATKLKVTTELADRGFITGDAVMDIWQMPHFDGGDKRIIRGEYIDASLISEHTVDDAMAVIEASEDKETEDAEQD